MSLAGIPLIAIADTGILVSGAFPDEDDMIVAVRDVPTLMLEPPWDNLDEALAEGGIRSSDYSLHFGEDSCVLDMSFYEPLLRFRVLLEASRYAEFIEGVRAAHMLVLATISNPDRLMLLTFSEEDPDEA